jgi:hypothetical protein
MVVDLLNEKRSNIIVLQVTTEHRRLPGWRHLYDGTALAQHEPASSDDVFQGRL